MTADNPNPNSAVNPDVKSGANRAGAILEIDLAVLGANYDILRHRAAPAECAAVLKADAYGLGAAEVGPMLAAMGCRTYFVAHLDEGLALRDIVGFGAAIYVLNGLLPETETELLAHDLVPVLNTVEQIAQWSRKARALEQTLPAALHVDTGMARLGLSGVDAADLAKAPEALDGLELHFIASHLACADEPDHPLNREQRQLFHGHLTTLPPAPASLANSSGIFLDPEFHYDLVRPGIALYGGNPTPGAKNPDNNPMGAVVRLRGKIIQVREIDTPQSVGYGATHQVTGPRRIATVPVGYADGYPRALSGCGIGAINGISIPIVGRVSMDLITLDITDVPIAVSQPGALVDLIGGDGPSLDAVAAAAGTIGYEILTSLGRRYHRRYLNGGLNDGLNDGPNGGIDREEVTDE